MKTIGVAVLLCLGATFALADDQTGGRQQVVIRKLQGDVTVRHGVTEVWTAIAQGDILRPEDSMKTGRKGSALLAVTAMGNGGPAVKVISLPPEVIVDVSDIRDLTQEELMLKLTMEKVRASSYHWKNNELRIPNATVVHGENQAEGAAPGENDPVTGELQMNGARVLFNNGYYSTCALRAMGIFRLYPKLGMVFDNRLMMADALAKANLRSEALDEYTDLSRMDNLSQQQSAVLHARIESLNQ